MGEGADSMVTKDIAADIFASAAAQAAAERP